MAVETVLRSIPFRVGFDEKLVAAAEAENKTVSKFIVDVVTSVVERKTVQGEKAERTQDSTEP